MVFGNALMVSLGFEDSAYKYFLYIFPANLGQGIVYPAILFTSLATFDHAGKEGFQLYDLVIHSLIVYRSRRFRINNLPNPLVGDCVWCCHHICHRANHAQCPASGCFERDRRQMDSTPLFLDGQLGEYSRIYLVQVIDEIRHSVSAIKTLPPDVQLKARLVYYDGLRYSFATSTMVAAAAFGAAMLARARGLRSTK